MTTWYDQSGNERNATQTTVTNQPRIVVGGSLFQEGSKPAIDFDGTNDVLEMPTIAFTMNAVSVFNLVSNDTQPAGGIIAFNSPDSNRLYVPFINSTSAYIGYSNSTTTFTFSSGAARRLFSLCAGTSVASAFMNGAAGTPATVTSSSASESGSALCIGSYQQVPSLFANFLDGRIQEVLFYTSDQTGSRSGIESNINSYYAIY